MIHSRWAGSIATSFVAKVALAVCVTVLATVMFQYAPASAEERQGNDSPGPEPVTSADVGGENPTVLLEPRPGGSGTERSGPAAWESVSPPPPGGDDVEAILGRMLLSKERLPPRFRVGTETRYSADVIRGVFGKTVASMTAGMAVQEIIFAHGVAQDGLPLAGKPARLHYLVPLTGMQQDVVSELIKEYGEGCSTFRLDQGVVRMSGTREVQEQVLGLFRLSETEVVKVKGAFLDTSWRLLREEPIDVKALRELGRRSGGTLVSGVAQTLWRSGETVRISYYEADSSTSAATIQGYLANTPIAHYHLFAQQLNTVVVHIRAHTAAGRNSTVRLLWRDRRLRVGAEIGPNRTQRFVPPGH